MTCGLESVIRRPGRCENDEVGETPTAVIPKTTEVGETPTAVVASTTGVGEAPTTVVS